MDLKNLLLIEKPYYYDAPSYTIALGPGAVRYLKASDFVDGDVETWIDTLRSLSSDSQIKISWQSRTGKGLYNSDYYSNEGLCLEDADDCFPSQTWDERLRTHHQFARLYRDKKLPSWVCRCFHKELGLELIAAEYCLDSWVKEAWCNSDMEETFVNSSEHILLPFNAPISDLRCVFRKTPFVVECLAAIEQKIQLRQADEEAQKAFEDAEKLRKSRFTTYIYLMQDLRNGQFKIGQSKTPNKRERTLQSEVPQIFLRLSIPADESHEKQLHNHFASKRVRGEWFALKPDDLLWIISFLKRDGDAARASVDYQWLGTIAFSASNKNS